MTDHAHELRRHARKIAHPAGDVPAVMLAAADEIERLRAESAGLVDDMNLLRDNNTALRARIEAMERQRPVRFVFKSDEMDEQIKLATGPIWAEVFEVPEGMVPLYALPGAKGEEK